MKKLAIAVAILTLVSCAKKNADIKTAIASFAGNVTVNGKAVASAGQAIQYGDLIQTGEASFCELIINEKNILRLAQNTGLVFNISGKDSALVLNKGWLAGVTKKIFSHDRSYLIKTPTAVASVRGTSFCTKVEAPDSTYFCVCNGRIELKKGNGDAGDLVIAAHHAARRYKKEKDGSIAIDKNPGLLYHKDEGIEALSKKIGTTVDWAKAE